MYFLVTKHYYKSIKAWSSRALLDLYALVSGLGTSNRPLGLRPRGLFDVPRPETRADKSNNAL